MRAHMRKHHTEHVQKDIFDNDIPISADEVINEICKEFGLPQWALSLKGYRIRENLTQTELGKALGIAQGNISKMEKGTKPIGKKVAKRLADFFKTDYKMFL